MFGSLIVYPSAFPGEQIIFRPKLLLKIYEVNWRKEMIYITLVSIV